jgi:hypothetical protein
MARMEIPALYRLDLGSSTWGWHKMSDLVIVVDLLVERLPENILPPIKIEAANPTKDCIHRLKGKRLLTLFGSLNREELFGWSDEIEIEFDEIKDVPWDRPNLFVPAQWSLDVIATIKNHGQPTRPSALQLFEVTSGCLTEREKMVMKLRLGFSDKPPRGQSWSLMDIAKRFKVTRERIRQIEGNAVRKMERATTAIKVKNYVRSHLLDATHIDSLDLTVRTLNCLSNADLDTVAKIRLKSRSDMLKLHNFGKKSLKEISDKFKERGIDLGWFEEEQ